MNEKLEALTKERDETLTAKNFLEVSFVLGAFAVKLVYPVITRYRITNRKLHDLSAAWPGSLNRHFYDSDDRKVDDSTSTEVLLLRS